VAVLVVGAPYLIRNMLLQGGPLGSDRINAFVLGPPLSLADRFRLVVFTNLALWTQLLTPPALFGQVAGEPVNAWFRDLATALGYTLPDPRWSFYPGWDGLLRHGTERYNLGHAFFGAAFVLVLVPAMIAVLARWKRLGPWRYAAGFAIFFFFSYIVTLAALFRFDIHLGRYLIEPVVVLAVLTPVLFRALPSRVAAIYGLAVASFLLVEMHDTIVANRQMPAGTVTVVPRSEQFYRYFGGSSSTIAAIRTFNEKYPPAQFPDVFVDFRGGPDFPDYAYLGPSLQRRTHYWSPLSADPPIPPGVFLTMDPDVVKRVENRPYVLLDRLSYDTWVIVPVDQFRVIFNVRRPMDGGPLQLDVRAALPPGVANPEFRFVRLCGAADCVVQEFSPNPAITVTVGTPPEIIRVEAREAGNPGPPQILYVESARYLGL
jgi:hypothetical protein